MTKRYWLFGLIAVIAVTAGVMLSWQWHTARDQKTDNAAEFRIDQLVIADLDGKPQPLAQWRGSLLLVNFWATWCPPCREEIPLFMAMRDKYGTQGFEVVGIAIDENEKVRDYRDELFIDYPLLQGERQTVQLMQVLGNRIGALPFSVLFDRNGSPIATKNGAYDHEELDRLIREQL